MSKLVYPEWFVSAIRDVFSDMVDADKPILKALRDNRFELGNLLFNYEQNIVIDLGDIAYHLTQTIKIMNLHDLDNPGQSDSDAACRHKKETMHVRDKIKKKLRTQDLHKQWVCVCETYEREHARRVARVPCEVIRRTES